MALTLTTTQEAEVLVGYADKNGNPALIDGTPVWAVSNAEILRVVPTADPSVVILQAVGPIGVSQVTVTADADLGEGVRELFAVQDVSVVAGEAVAAAINFGLAREQPAPVEPEPEPAPVEPEPAPVEPVVE